MAISNSASPEIIWGLGGPEEDHQLHHCCWTGCVGEREEEDERERQIQDLLFICSGSQQKCNNIRLTGFHALQLYTVYSLGQHLVIVSSALIPKYV